MAGGIWTTQNKVRPGAYINFETENPIVTEVGSRGIATLAMDLDWGDENKLIEVTMEDLAGGNSLAKVGFILSDAKAKLPNLILQNASVLKIYRLNKNGVKAKITGTQENPLNVEAKYPGTLGNKIAILVANANEYGQYNVQTYVNGYLVDNQLAANIDDLKANEFVTFSGTGTITEMTATLLTGGTNGEIPSTTSGEGAEQTTSYVTAYENYFEVLRLTRWNTLAITTTDEDIALATIDFIRDMRENEGKYVQAVVPNSANADYEGIINNINGVILEDETEINPAEFCAWVAGATAGAAMNESLTGKVIDGAVTIIDLKTNDQIIDGLGKGQFLLSLNQDGTVKVEKDINSLHTFTDKSYTFSKNRVIRELDEIGSGIEGIWETTYLGKVTNNDDGRMLFKSSIIDFLTTLFNNGSIDEFDAENIVVSQGNDVDAVVASIAVKPLDSMEFLYMTVNIEQ